MSTTGKQKVRLGVTQSGTTGFFTNGFLAISLSVENFIRAKQEPAFAFSLAARYNFELITTEE